MKVKHDGDHIVKEDSIDAGMKSHQRKKTKHVRYEMGVAGFVK